MFTVYLFIKLLLALIKTNKMHKNHLLILLYHFLFKKTQPRYFSCIILAGQSPAHMCSGTGNLCPMNLKLVR